MQQRGEKTGSAVPRQERAREKTIRQKSQRAVYNKEAKQVLWYRSNQSQVVYEGRGGGK